MQHDLKRDASVSKKIEINATDAVICISISKKNVTPTKSWNFLWENPKLILFSKENSALYCLKLKTT